MASFLKEWTSKLPKPSGEATVVPAPKATESTPFLKISDSASAVANQTATAATETAKQIKYGALKIKNNLVEVNRENPSSYRTWKVIAAVLMLSTSVLDLLLAIFVEVDFRRVVLSMYTFFFATLICLVEARVFLLPEVWRRDMLELFPLLDRTWGRGAYFLFVGVLQATQGGTVPDYVSGGCCAQVGLLCLVTAYLTNGKLLELHESIDGTLALRMALSQEFSVDGHVDRQRLRHFGATQGIALSSHELEAAFDTLDADRDGRVSVDEFVLWYDTWSPHGSDEGPTLLV